ncbi:FAD-dependent oxidoreductase [Sporomusa termitida]|uniref:L-aspartate oxidase n=1 Tax=Sporomusa termitida TaxID=2377 RepID=A0A517DWP7_9FIRM|nr:FAD-dependent oxidoreductase [Sporomusa termitida]QDR81753.1 L-aspartate oxidase [Sporomusa termitida]
MFETKKTDILVIGGGGAGIKAAIAAAEQGRQVVLLSKGPLAKTGITPVAGEGIEGAVNAGDSVEMHFKDTVTAGRGLADQDLAKALAEDSVERIKELEAYGAKFKKKEDGTFATSVRPGQSHSRNLFIMGGGWGLAASLHKKVAQLPNVFIIDSAVVTRFLVRDDRVIGVVYLNTNSGEIRVIQAKATLLATGGYEELWPFTDTPPDATGETLVMVYQVGAQLVDLEMVLYYPGVVVYPPAARGWLVQYEYILNPDILDGRVLNGKEEVFVEGFPARDEFIKAIRQEVKKGTASPHGGFFVDLTHSKYPPAVLTERITAWLHQFGNLLNVGIDLRTDKLEMAPAAHYCLGGIKIDEHGRTNVPGLFAAGEITGNVHGANRISGNALSETQVFGRRAALSACQFAAKVDFAVVAAEQEVLTEYRQIDEWKQDKEYAVRPIALKSRLKTIMDQYVGLERNEESLNTGLRKVRDLRKTLSFLKVVPHKRYCYEVQEAYEVRGMLALAEIVILSALARQETRGHHFRTDYPQTEAEGQHTLISLQQGEPKVTAIPVTKL